MADTTDKVRNHLLVVEDDDNLREVIIRTLLKAGVRAGGAADGAGALALIRESAFDAILLDQILPDMTGRQIIASLDEQQIKIPFIMMTGQGDERLAVEMMKLGAADYLIKDTDFLDLLPVSVKRVLSAIGMERALREAEDNLRKSEQQYKELADSITDIFFLMNEDLKLAYWNRTLEKMTGIAAKDAIGRSITDIYPDVPDISETLSVYRRVIDTRQPQSFEKEITFEGKTMCYEISAYPALSGISVFAKDITGRKRTEEALANAEKLESLGILAGGIAHDFNNLMGGIFGYIEIAREISTEERVKHDLSKVMQTLERARALTQQLLTFAKGGDPIRTAGPLFPFVEQTVQFALSGSNVLCRFDVADNLWSASFDKNQIGQVIDNLVINAQHAMPLGGTIVVRSRNVMLAGCEHPMLDAGSYITLSVTDSGIGIPKELQKRIFDPFFTTKAKGHGLGLATCHSIISRHEGTIDVESEPGKGSTFTIYLPAADADVFDTNAKIVLTHRGSGTFLVMDDEEVIRETVSAMLSSLGYNVVCRENGQTAVDYVASELSAGRKPAGMIFDLTVAGGMGGREAVALIRRMDADIPVFVASGYADDPIIKNPAEYGFTASICKPFMSAELTRMLESTMCGKV